MLPCRILGSCTCLDWVVDFPNKALNCAVVAVLPCVMAYMHIVYIVKCILFVFPLSMTNMCPTGTVLSCCTSPSTDRDLIGFIKN